MEDTATDQPDYDEAAETLQRLGSQHEVKLLRKSSTLVADVTREGLDNIVDLVVNKTKSEEFISKVEKLTIEGALEWKREVSRHVSDIIGIREILKAAKRDKLLREEKVKARAAAAKAEAEAAEDAAAIAAVAAEHTAIVRPLHHETSAGNRANGQVQTKPTMLSSEQIANYNIKTSPEHETKHQVEGSLKVKGESENGSSNGSLKMTLYNNSQSGSASYSTTNGVANQNGYPVKQPRINYDAYSNGFQGRTSIQRQECGAYMLVSEDLDPTSAGIPKMKCTKCDPPRDFAHYVGWQKHIQYHFPAEVWCPQSKCDYRTTLDRAQVERHIMLAHPGLRFYRCKLDNCNYLSIYDSPVIRHILNVHWNKSAISPADRANAKRYVEDSGTGKKILEPPNDDSS